MASVPVTKGRLSDWSLDLLISASLHRQIIARKAVAAARSHLAECDSDAKTAGLDMQTLRRATRKAAMTPADHRREEDADGYVHAMRSLALGACSEEPRAGALSSHAASRSITAKAESPHDARL